MLDQWLEIVEHRNFSLQFFLASEKQQIQWQGEGLPTDQLSAQNAIVILKVFVLQNFLQAALTTKFCREIFALLYKTLAQ